MAGHDDVPRETRPTYSYGELDCHLTPCPYCQQPHAPEFGCVVRPAEDTP